MTALRPGKRRGTAREMAERLGVSDRTIRNYMAQPRAEYISDASKRRQRIRVLRAQGMSYRAIAAEVGCSISTVHYALKNNEAA